MPSPTPRSLVLSGGRLVTMDAKRRVVDGDVVVEDGKIESVGVGRGRAGTGRVIDCTGLVIIPGLIQAHMHLCQTLFRGLADDLPLDDCLAACIWPLQTAQPEELV